MALIFLGAFIWSLKNGQHDDVVTPGMRVLFDDEIDLKSNSPDPDNESDKDHFLS
jgi:cbb3-type cytochrome oxidase maturation protein